MDTATAALVASAAATCGWLYTARRARALSRKQHTITVMLQASFNKEFQEHRDQIRHHIINQSLPKILENQDDTAARRVLNHYEFIAAGLRNGDFDERLVKDSERSAIIRLYTGCKSHIWSLRNDRDRMAMYEHLEWLHDRWCVEPCPWYQKIIEAIIQRPFAGKRHQVKRKKLN